MEQEPYTLGRWLVKPGQQEAFITAWTELGVFFSSLPHPPGTGTLLRSIDNPHLFYSFGPWRNLDDIQAMRADPRTPAMISQLAALCTEATPGTFIVVATVP